MAQPNQNVAQVPVNLGNVGKQLSSLCLELKASQVINGIPKFDGSGHTKFIEWLKAMEKSKLIIGADDERMRGLTMGTLTGAAADFAIRGIQQNPDVSWEDIRSNMKSRYSDLADAQFAKQSLKNLTQNADESVQNYSERLFSGAKEAFPGQDLSQGILQNQLVDIFTNGVRDMGTAKKLTRKKPATLEAAVEIAKEEQTAARSFRLLRQWDAREEEDMEIGALTKKKSGLEEKVNQLTEQLLTLTKVVQEMSSGSTGKNKKQGEKKKFPFTADGRPICFRCREAGHMIKDCPTPPLNE